MSQRFDLLIRNARDESGGTLSIGIRDGRIAAMAAEVQGDGPEFDARGWTAGPGLHDHHIHLLATAARMQSVDLAGCGSVDGIVARLRAGAGKPGTRVRAIGYDERVAGLPDRWLLDAWLPDHPLRMQDRTGGYWLLNSPAIAELGAPPWPPGVELDAHGAPGGRIWRSDAWLRERTGGTPPPLAPLGAELARRGVTGVTDAGASNGPEEARILAGALPQRLVLMGNESLRPGDRHTVGAVKILLDENDLPPLRAIVARITKARALERTVAAHCVTLGELVFWLEALAQAGGAMPGDRIEHGGMIPETMIGDIVAAGLMVVTQPNFIHDRGDRYLAQMAARDLGDLYRLASLLRCGVPVRAGSDAPYGDPDPWTGIQAATNRRTRGGAVIGRAEAIDRRSALRLYQSPPLFEGRAADLILYDWPDIDASATVSLTLIGGEIAWQV